MRRHSSAWAVVAAWLFLHAAMVASVAAAAQDLNDDGGAAAQIMPAVHPALSAVGRDVARASEGAGTVETRPPETEPDRMGAALADAGASLGAALSAAKSRAAAAGAGEAGEEASPAAAESATLPATPEPVPSPAPVEADESVLLNFERGDIREVIHSLATALGLSYMIDPRVEGEVTIRTLGRIPKDHLFPVFNRILRNNGIAAIPVDGVYHIVPVDEAKTRAIMPPTAASREQLEQTDSFVIEIIPLHHVASEDMVPIIEPFLAEGGDVYSYPRGNLLIVTDLMSNIERLRYLIQTLDTNAFEGMHTAVVKIKHGDLDVIAEELTALLASYGQSIDGSTGLSLIPMPRLESMTVISYDRAVLDQVRAWVEMLDISPDEGAGRRVRVYHVENAKAADLAAILNELFGGGGGGGGGGRGARRGSVAQPRTAFGRPAPAARRGATRTRRPARRPANTRSARQVSAGSLNSIRAEQRSQGGLGAAGRRGRARANQTAGQRRGRRGGGGTARAGVGGGGAVGFVLPGGRAGGGGLGSLPGVPPIFKEEVTIVADDVTNSLVILAVKQDYEKIVSVLKEIDVVPRQVVIEVMIAEVSLNGALEFGIDNAVRYGLGGDNKGVSAIRTLQGIGNSSGTTGATTSDTSGTDAGGTDTGDGGTTDTSSGSDGFDALLNSLFAIADPTGGGIASVITDRNNFGIALRALASRGLVKIVSSPQIIAADNREAHIQVGESIPVLSSSSASTASNLGTITNQVQYRDVGTIVTILPQVNSAGLVNMQIQQEISGVGQASFGNTNSPSFSTRTAETTVVVQDGDSVLIGGIINHERRVSRSGVPFLMDIPVLGRMFRSERASMARTELLVLITPHVILNRKQALAVTEEFKSIVHGFDRMVGNARRGMARDREPTPPGAEDPF